MILLVLKWLFGAAGALAVSAAAFWKRSLSFSGLMAAFVMGTVYFGAGNAFWFGILLLFFITSSLLSKMKAGIKEELERDYAKTGRRDAGQVLANGGVGMLFVLAHAIRPLDVWPVLFIGAMATVTADTWATELGTLSRRPPRSVRTGRVLRPGQSGGVSLLGTAAAAAGGLLIGAAGWLLAQAAGMDAGSLIAWSAAGLVGGLAGAFADSLLGATVQAMNRCATCGREVEAAFHHGRPTLPGRGWRWMNNDAVNAISSLLGSAAALLAAALLGGI
ncbi:DUF92 domain-containing protein [Paenibacillus spiritus]|uniref:DUF92 domain-containing protein n=1 Tax=Paenibacillus spiritus TaxID=2496557 RepID=A0A5J5FZY1_9BACL|nr:DUF92 domain-containing protein [Paenibacillus spiritus]KAA8999809.1 DUF92 domain-containing protein [Paenibacillus spiritus]